jgi:hypothetical protein
MRGEGRPEYFRPQREQALRLLDQVGQLLNAAESDSYAVWEVRHSWRRFHDQATALMETLGHWRTSLPEVESLDHARLLTNLDDLWSELDLRFTQIERMLGGQAPERMPLAVTLEVDKARLANLTRFQTAALAVTQGHLERLEALSRSFFDCVRDLRGYGAPTSKAFSKKLPRGELAIDLDRLQGVISVLVMLWSSFLIWVYVDPPGHASFVTLSTVYVMAMVRTGGNRWRFGLWMVIGSVAAGIPYVFIMPHLSRFSELGLMIFAISFAIGYLLSKPSQGDAKMGLLIQFVISISVQNEQTYSFASYANSLAMTGLVVALLLATAYIPFSPRPEKVFLRLYRRFFRHAEFLLSGLGPAEQRLRGNTGRWQVIFYRNSLLELPSKLARYAQSIDYRAFPANTPERVQALVSSLYDLAFRYRELGACPRIAIVARARLIESDFSII